MCKDREVFNHLEESAVSGVLLADKGITPTEGQGSVTLNLNSPENLTLTLNEVLHVPGLRENLLSVRALVCHDYKDISIEFLSDACVFKRGGLEIHRMPLTDSLWLLKAGITELASSARAVGTYDLSLWHLRLNHLNKRTLVEMVRKGLLPGVELKDEDEYVLRCIGCGLGKMHKEPHKRRTWRAEKLELIHTDLCGPMDTATLLHGKAYFMTFIDDYSRRSWVRLLAHKDEAFECFQEWLAEVERETGLKVKVLKSDGGGEYVNSSFKAFLGARGIKHKLIIARTPQQNGVAERINRTLLDGVRSMLHGVGLTKGFWGWALECFNYTRNRVPTRGRSDGVSPYEAWTGRKPNLSHLKTFGSPVLYRYDDQSRKKLDPRARKGILVGYPTNKAGYRVWDKELHRLLDVRELAAYEITVKEQNFDPKYVSMPRQTTLPLLLQSEEVRDLQTAEVSIEGGTERREPADRNKGQLESTTSRDKNVQAEEVRDLQPAITDSGGAENSLSQQTEIAPEESVNLDECAPEHTSEEDTDRSHRNHAEMTEEVTRIPDHSEISRPEPENTTQRPARVRRPPARLVYDFAGEPHWENHDASASSVTSNMSEPKTYFEVLQSSEKEKWLTAMEEEEESILELNTYTEADRPPKSKLIDSKWVLKLKKNQDGTHRYKARVVARGFSQRFGEDYEEVYAPTLSYKTFRLLCALAVKRGFHIHQLDIKTAFLYADIDKENIYVRPPPGVTRTTPGKVWKLNKSLYGLKQSPRLWHEKISKTLCDDKFENLHGDPTCYSRGEGATQVIICLFVDDILVFSESLDLINRVKARLVKEYTLTDVGQVSRYLNMQIHYDRKKGVLMIEQEQYITDKLEEFNMSDCKSAPTPLPAGCKLSTIDCPQVGSQEWTDMQLLPYRRLIGSLMYLSGTTRPDLAFAMSQLSRFNNNPGKAHWNAALHVLKYLKGTKTVGLRYDKGNSNFDLCGYCDSDYAGCPDTCRSTGGFVFKLSGCAITWGAKRQTSVAQSSSEAEYVSTGVAALEATWLREFLEELTHTSHRPTIIHCDSTAAIAMSKNPVHRERTKHIGVKAHYIRNQVRLGNLILTYVHTSVQAADIMTKSLGGTALKQCCNIMGLSDTRSTHKSHASEEGL